MQHLICPEEALSLVLNTAQLLLPQRQELLDSIGATLAEDIISDRDYPPFNRAMMDGFAVHPSEGCSELRIIGEIAAGEYWKDPLRPGEAIAIMTGAPCPEGTDFILPIEAAIVKDSTLHIPKVHEQGKHIAIKGSECRKNCIVANSGERITPLHIANLAAFGYTSVSVRRPMVAIITTGTELMNPGKTFYPWHIRNSNGPMLQALTRQTGASLLQILKVNDDSEALQNALELASQADIIVLSGGVSMGKYDLVPAAFKAHDIEIVFHKVAQKPGKPLLFGNKGSRQYFGLPGNPLACHACFCNYVLPAIRKRAGLAEPTLQTGILKNEIAAPPTRTYLALCRANYLNNKWCLTHTKGKGSADIHSVCGANAYVHIKAGETRALGTTAQFLYIGDSHDG